MNLEVLEALKHESALRARRQRLYQLFLAACLGIPLFVMLLGLVGTYGHIGPFAHRAFGFDDILGTFGAFGLMGSYVGFSSKQKALTREAAALRKPEAIPFLVEALGSGDKDLAAVAKEALAQILPYVTPEEAAAIPIDWKKIMTHTLTKDTAFQMCAMEGMRQVGGKDEVAYLDAFAAGHLPLAPGKVQQKVKVTALTASADLRMRLARQVIDGKNQEVEQARNELGLD